MRDDYEAAADALSRLEADNTAEVELEVAEVEARIARLEVVRPVAEDLIARLAAARSTISNAKHLLRTSAGAGPVFDDRFHWQPRRSR